MAVPAARHAPSPVLLLVYPLTLLLGSLFSAISPTARSSKPVDPSQSSGALAPSLAADLHLSESPVNYFARKNNVFNLYFVKVGWLWTTVAFASLLLAQPTYHFTSSLLSPQQQQTRFRRCLQAFLRYVLATATWYLMTQWFFGPAIIDRSFVVTGGKCEEVLNEVGKAAADPNASVQLEALFTAAACKTAGGAWRGGHDISGHVFMLVLATAILAFEAIGAGALGSFPHAVCTEGEIARERKASDPEIPRASEMGNSTGMVKTWSLRLVWGVVGLGWWMLFMTAIWFHTWLEKVRRDGLQCVYNWLTNISLSGLAWASRSALCMPFTFSPGSYHRGGTSLAYQVYSHSRFFGWKSSKIEYIAPGQIGAHNCFIDMLVGEIQNHDHHDHFLPCLKLFALNTQILGFFGLSRLRFGAQVS